MKTVSVQFVFSRCSRYTRKTKNYRRQQWKKRLTLIAIWKTADGIDEIKKTETKILHLNPDFNSVFLNPTNTQHVYIHPMFSLKVSSQCHVNLAVLLCVFQFYFLFLLLN